MGGESSEISETTTGCCWRRRTSRRWRSPGRRNGSACAPRHRLASSAAATRGASTGRPPGSASCWGSPSRPGHWTCRATCPIAGPRRSRRPGQRGTRDRSGRRRGRRPARTARLRLRAIGCGLGRGGAYGHGADEPAGRPAGAVRRRRRHRRGRPDVRLLPAAAPPADVAGARAADRPPARAPARPRRPLRSRRPRRVDADVRRGCRPRAHRPVRPGRPGHEPARQ